MLVVQATHLIWLSALQLMRELMIRAQFIGMERFGYRVATLPSVLPVIILNQIDLIIALSVIDVS